MRKYNMSKIVGNKKTTWINMQVRKLTIPMTELFARYSNITPDQVSYFAILLSLVSIMLFSLGYFIAGSIFLFSVCIADHIDGKLARILDITSKRGEWLDGMTDIVYLPLVMLSISIGLKSYFIGMFATLAFAMHYMIVFKWKADFIEQTKEQHMGIKKESKLRFIYGGYLVYYLVPLLSFVGYPILALYFFGIVGNLFWMALLFLQWKVMIK